MVRGSFRGIALGLVVVFSLTACSHRFSINSNPTGARTYVDDQFIGLTPATFVERSGMGREYQIRLEKEGYHSVNTKEKQGINLTFLAISLLFTCGIGILWSFTLEDRYDYSLEKE